MIMAVNIEDQKMTVDKIIALIIICIDILFIIANIVYNKILNHKKDKNLVSESSSYKDMINFSRNDTKSEEDDIKNNTLENAFKFANNCRDKEIDRFWTRGLYFWGFIAASFGAYMAVFNASLVTKCEGIKDSISLVSIIDMSFTAKVALFVLSFICFIFCLSWLLSHKGSKFWQENWETHISYLENDYMGKIYKNYLDTKNYLDFNESPFSAKAYDYSVSKISLLCSLLLTICSFDLSLFHIVIFSLEKDSNEIVYLKQNGFLISIILAIIAIAFIVFYCINISGNKLKKGDKQEKKQKEADKNNKEKYSKNYNYFSSRDSSGKRIIIKIKKENDLEQ